MQPGDKLQNGAHVVEIYMSTNKNVVLADWTSTGDRAKFVTWELDNAGNSYRGHYFDTVELARKDFFSRICSS